MNKKFIPIILAVISIIISTFLWEKIILTYDVQNQIYGEYSKNNYNPINDVLRFLFFISFPLIVFLYSYLTLNNEKTFSLKEVIINDKEKILKKGINQNYNLFFIIIIIFLFAEFLSLNFNIFTKAGLDFFHEGTFLTPSNNSNLGKGFWSSSYIELGLFGNFGPFFLWEIFNIKTIGIPRFFSLTLLLLNKILLIFLSKKISENLSFKNEIKLIYFTILSLLLISLVSYEDNASEFGPRLSLFLIFFLIFFNSLKKFNKFSFSFFVLGTFSTISMIWYIDVGAYINALLLFILIYFSIRSELKKFTSIILGIIFSWMVFIFFIPTLELNEFVNNTLSIYTTYDYIIGLIYPTPFFSGDARSTRALLLIIISGIFVIIINFNKNINQTYYNKTFFAFIFLASLLLFKSGLTRADSPHIKASSGFTLFLIYSIGLYFLFSWVFSQINTNNSILKFNNFLQKNYTKVLLALIVLFFVVVKNNSINLNNISSSMKEIVKLTTNEDNKYLNSDYKELVKYYNGLINFDKCVQILTNEAALPYLLKKPTCTKFYLMWNSGPNQKKFIEQLKESKPQIILYNSEIDPYNDVVERTPMIMKYVDQNYYFHSKFKYWTFVKLK